MEDRVIHHVKYRADVEAEVLVVVVVEEAAASAEVVVVAPNSFEWWKTWRWETDNARARIRNSNADSTRSSVSNRGNEQEKQ